MNKNAKEMMRYVYSALIFVLLFAYVSTPNLVFATENMAGKITISYVDDRMEIENGECIQKSVALGGAEFSISLVAIENNGEFQWIDEIEQNQGFPYHTNDLANKDMFEAAAHMLVEYSDSFVTYSNTTDINGQCTFDNLEKGIYLVWQSSSDGIALKYHTAVPFFIEVPNRQAESYNFEVIAYPKAELITERIISIVGVKRWQGEDAVNTNNINEDNQGGVKVQRPEYIVLRLYANGEEVARTMTNADKNWSFAFDDVNALDDNGNEVVFAIKEDPIKGYIFSQDEIIVGENTIIINVTNTVNDLVQTGDDTQIELWMFTMLFSIVGIALVLKRIVKRASIGQN